MNDVVVARGRSTGRPPATGATSSGGRGRGRGSWEDFFLPREYNRQMRVGVGFAPQPLLLRIGREFEGWTFKIFEGLRVKGF